MCKCENVAKSSSNANWKLATVKLATLATLATFMAGCYIGKAEFKGEDMKMYPFFGTTAAPAE